MKKLFISAVILSVAAFCAALSGSVLAKASQPAVVSAETADAPRLAVDAQSCNEVTISYRNGGPVPPDALLRTTLEYTYSTTEKSEIKQIIDRINAMSLTMSDSQGFTADGVYLSIEFGGADTEVFFDVTSALCTFNGANYNFVLDDYHQLSDLIYSFRTKDDIKVHFDNTLLKPAVAPQLMHNRTLIPVHNISAALQADVQWDRESQSVLITKENNTVIFVIDQNYMIVNDEKIELDVGAKLVNQYAMIPIRALAESFGCSVLWKDQAVFIYSDGNDRV